MAKHFSTGELHTELIRAAYVVGVHGPYRWGHHVLTLQRFLTHPHFQETTMTTSPTAPADRTASYQAELHAANLPAVRIEPRLTGFRDGWAAAVAEPEGILTPWRVEKYRAELAKVVGNGYQYCSSAALGFQDGWNTVREGQVLDSM